MNKQVAATSSPPQPPGTTFPSSQNQILAQDRLFFPYSIIPGEVESAKELKNALRNDPVVAAHYKDFDLAKARIIRVQQDRAVYVAYRLGSSIFWTRRKLNLERGESLITDGLNAARACCGNRISEAPAGPVSPEEPTAEVLEKAEDPGLLTNLEPPFDLPTVPPPTSDIHPSIQGGEIYIPPAFPIIFEDPPTTPGIPINPPPSPPPPAPSTQVSEPGTLLLLSTGLAITRLLRRNRKS